MCKSAERPTLGTNKPLFNAPHSLFWRKFGVAILSLFFAGISHAWTWETISPKPGWADSYSHGGVCYIDSTFDHGIGDKVVNGYTVRQLANLLPKGPGKAGNPVYNDVQCGNGPANNAGDEDLCPGRVDMGKAGCHVIGPKWDMSALAQDDDTTEPTPTGERCQALAWRLPVAQRKFKTACAGVVMEACNVRSNGSYICYGYESGTVEDPQETICITRAWRKVVALRKFASQCATSELAHCSNSRNGAWYCESTGSVVSNWSR